MRPIRTGSRTDTTGRADRTADKAPYSKVLSCALRTPGTLKNTKQVAAPGVLASSGFLEGDIAISVGCGLYEDGQEAGRNLRGSFQQKSAFSV